MPPEKVLRGDFGGLEVAIVTGVLLSDLIVRSSGDISLGRALMGTYLLTATLPIKCFELSFEGKCMAGCVDEWLRDDCDCS